jgi:predicted PurR-regulated permease PerM
MMEPGTEISAEARVVADRRIGRGAFLLLLAIAISALFFRMVQGFVLALILAAVFAALAHPTYRKLLSLFQGRAGPAAALTLLLGTVLVVLPLMGFLTVVARQATDISAAAEPWIARQIEQSSTLERRLEGVPWLAELAPYQDQIVAKVSQLGGSVARFAVNRLATGTAGTAKFFLLLFVLLYAMFFFLQEGQGILERLRRYVPLPEADIDRMLGTFTSVTRASLKGTAVIGLVQGFLAGVAFGVAGIPGPAFWGLLIAVLALLPGLGPTIVWVPAVIFLAINGQYGTAIGLGVWCFAVVSTIDNFLRPWLMGKDTKMPDLLILLGTLGGLALFGAVGIIIGPIIAALFLTVWDLYGSAVDDLRAATEAVSGRTRA